MSVLSISGISKTYGPIRALNNVTFDVPEGSVFGILGPNGSGKTTLLGILLDVLLADQGTFQWMANSDAQAARRQIGALLETPNFYHYLSAERNLEINAAIKKRGADDIERVLKLVGLYERRGSKFSTFSLGMKQRLAIGAALLGKPKVLVFDEPTNGLDPAGIAEIRQLVRTLHAEGITIIMASHLLDEIEKVCTHVAVLKLGRLLVTGNVNEVMRSEDQIEVRAENLSALELALKEMNGIQQISASEGALQVSANERLTTTMINQHCISKGIVLSHLVQKKKSLEAKFMELTE